MTEYGKSHDQSCWRLKTPIVNYRIGYKSCITSSPSHDLFTRLEAMHSKWKESGFRKLQCSDSGSAPPGANWTGISPHAEPKCSSLTPFIHHYCARSLNITITRWLSLLLALFQMLCYAIWLHPGCRPPSSPSLKIQFPPLCRTRSSYHSALKYLFSQVDDEVHVDVRGRCSFGGRDMTIFNF